MSRLLFIALIIAVVYWLLRSYRRQSSQDEQPTSQTEDMVRCAHCGVHLPKQEGILADGSYFCSEAHRRAHAGRSE